MDRDREGCNPHDTIGVSRFSLVKTSANDNDVSHDGSAVSFGIARRTFDVHDKRLGEQLIDSEAQLLMIGVFNKVMDYLMENTIENIVLTILILRMTRPDTFGAQFAGVRMCNLELKEELTKPWMLVQATYRRLKTGDVQKSKGLNSALLVLKLVVSVCFPLIGVGFNTVGYPKARWYPDLYLPDIPTPQQTLVDVDWPSDRDAAIRQVGDNPSVWPVAHAISGAKIYNSFLNGCNWTTSIGSDRWQYVDGFVAKVSLSQNLVTTAAYQLDQLRKIHDQLRQSGPEVAQISAGMLGRIRTTTAQLKTSCSLTNSTSPSMMFQKLTSSSFSLHIPYNGSQGSLFMTCSLGLRQTLLQIPFYTKDQNEVLLLNPGVIREPIVIGTQKDLDLLEVSEEDELLVDKLVQHMNDILPVLDRATPGLSFINLTSLMVDSAIARGIAQNTSALMGIPDMMTPMVACLTQHVLSSANWTTKDKQDNSTALHDLRFWVYGSGPRLTPEYIAAVPLFVMALVCIFDLFLLVYRVAPAPWLEPAGLLCLANMSSKLGSIGHHDEAAIAKAEIFVKVKIEDNELQIVDKRPANTELPERRQGYRYR